jgi:hypothetical protein
VRVRVKMTEEDDIRGETASLSETPSQGHGQGRPTKRSTSHANPVQVLARTASARHTIFPFIFVQQDTHDIDKNKVKKKRVRHV